MALELGRHERWRRRLYMIDPKPNRRLRPVVRQSRLIGCPIAHPCRARKDLAEGREGIGVEGPQGNWHRLGDRWRMIFDPVARNVVTTT